MPRTVIGTVSLSELFVTFAISASFVVALMGSNLPTDMWEYAEEIAGLIVGGLAAAPLAGLIARRVSARHLTLMVGLLVLGLAAWQIARSLD